jgi:hypothetical protein
LAGNNQSIVAIRAGVEKRRGFRGFPHLSVPGLGAGRRISSGMMAEGEKQIPPEGNDRKKRKNKDNGKD